MITLNTPITFKRTICTIADLKMKEGDKKRVKFSGDRYVTTIIMKDGIIMKEEDTPEYKAKVQVREEKFIFNLNAFINKLKEEGWVEVDTIKKQRYSWWNPHFYRTLTKDSFASYEGPVNIYIEEAERPNGKNWDANEQAININLCAVTGKETKYLLPRELAFLTARDIYTTNDTEELMDKLRESTNKKVKESIDYLEGREIWGGDAYTIDFFPALAKYNKR